MKYKFLLIVAGLVLMGTGAYSAAKYSHMHSPVVFYAGHTHDASGEAIGAPSHSGGLDRQGCHNASVPYHCH